MAFPAASEMKQDALRAFTRADLTPWPH